MNFLNLYKNFSFGFTSVCAGIPQISCGTTIAPKKLKKKFTEIFSFLVSNLANLKKAFLKRFFF
jgi:hypothetical protein